MVKAIAQGIADEAEIGSVDRTSTVDVTPGRDAAGKHRAPGRTPSRRRRTRRMVVALMVAAVTSLTAASAAYASGQIHNVEAVFYSSRQVGLRAQVSDVAGDAYCTATTARLFNSSGRQLGNEIPLGSVCRGLTAWTPWKTISTQAGDIRYVVVTTYRGSGGPVEDTFRFYRY